MALGGDHDVLVEALSPDAWWFGEVFPEASYAARLGAGGDLRGLARTDPTDGGQPLVGERPPALAGDDVDVRAQGPDVAVVQPSQPVDTPCAVNVLREATMLADASAKALFVTAA